MMQLLTRVGYKLKATKSISQDVRMKMITIKVS